MKAPPLPDDIGEVVARALAEDVGSGDITAALVGSDERAAAQVLVKEPAVLCGTAWFDEVFRQLDASVDVQWRHRDGDAIEIPTTVCSVSGPARALVSGERTGLNFLQTLSGTATSAHRYARAVRGMGTRILDTRKTVPGLRTAQKYAVRCGGANNHRGGLFDAVLIKENHIVALGGVAAAVSLAARNASGQPILVEVEDFGQLREALDTQVDRILLDNLSSEELREAVRIRDAHAGGRKPLEASGGVDLDGVRSVAATGVDYISVGALTKNVNSIDFSMRFV